MNPDQQRAEIPRRMIVIDDNPDIHKDFATILTAESQSNQIDELESELFGHDKPQPEWSGPQFSLDFATQGQQGAEKIKSALEQGRPYQLAFVDMRMPPGWDGLKTIEAIWRIDARVQVVLCTAYSDYSWEEINQSLGVTENLLILKKPFDSSEVAQLACTLTQKWLLAEKAALKQDELERLVDRRTKALKQSNQKLRHEMAERRALEDQLVRSQKMEAIGTLAAGVAHDLNNILSGILSYPDLLLVNMKEADPLYRPLSIIRNSGRKAAAIVQDMLTLARRDVAIKEPVDYSRAVQNFLESPEYRSLKDFCPDVRIKTRFAPDLPLVHGSPIHMEKIAMNLIVNAAEAMQQGGTIQVDLRPARLEGTLPGYTSVKPGAYVRFTVSDEGVGIAEDDLEHIFEPFFTKKKMGRSGTGLGMTVVWDSVNHHDGYLHVQSTVGKGTVISVYLPVSDRAAPAAKANPAQDTFTGDGERILVVDDVEEQREIATAIFRELGYDVDTVPSGEAAVDYVQKRPMDLLLLDMIMDPGIDGLETLQRILAVRPGQKVVLASGYTKNERVRKALELGANFVRKPYRITEIARAVKESLAKS